LLSKPDADAVYDVIMATANYLQARPEKQYYPGFSGDLDLFLDLDLTSLASPWEEFVEDLARIRTEFLWAPEVVFCSIQLQILNNFAKRRCAAFSTRRDQRKMAFRRDGQSQALHH
jgi:predicted metal-dependent HD superfamily phosphohydrolase